MDRERKHWEHEIQQKNSALEEATLKAKRLDTENFNLKKKVTEMEAEMVEREACEAKVQEYVKQLIKERN